MDNNKKVYHIPVNLIKSQTFKIEADNQKDAVDQLTAFLKNHQATKNMFNEFEIKDWDIECDKDDEMIENVIKDFNLEVKEGNGVEYVTHNVGVDTIHPGINKE